MPQVIEQSLFLFYSGNIDIPFPTPLHLLVCVVVSFARAHLPDDVQGDLVEELVAGVEGETAVIQGSVGTGHS